MSVAFRRESDEEHLEPRFELPVPPGPNPVTPRGFEMIAAKVAMLEAEARELAGTEAQAAVLRDLRYWRKRLASAEIVHPRESEEAVFGSHVRFLLNDAERAVTIVGHDEADRDRDQIAITSPLARALIGAGVGDMIAFGGTAEAIEVVAVSKGAGAEDA